MFWTIADYVFLAVAAIPFIYYLIALYSAWAYFRSAAQPGSAAAPFLGPVSNLKPIRGLDPDAYENFASFCRQDYPEYEIVFCVDSDTDPADFLAKFRVIGVIAALGGQIERHG